MNRHAAVGMAGATDEGLVAVSALAASGGDPEALVLGTSDIERLTSAQGIASALAEAADEISRAEGAAALGRALYRNLEVWVGLKSVAGRVHADGLEQSRADIGALADHVVGVTLGFARDYSVAGVTSLVEINLKVVEGLVAAATAAIIRECGDDAWRAAGAPAGEDTQYRHAAEQEVRATLDAWRGAGH